MKRDGTRALTMLLEVAMIEQLLSYSAAQACIDLISLFKQLIIIYVFAVLVPIPAFLSG